MIDNVIYVDPFLQKSEREIFVQNYKKMQKEIRESNMVSTQTVFRTDSISDIPKLAFQCFQENRILVIIRENNMFQDLTMLTENSNGMVN
jgi:hypothetical protein